MDKENIEINEIISHQNTIQDKSLSEKIELKLQKENKICIPAIILEYTEQGTKKEFELENLKNFFNNFGEVLYIVIKEKKSIVLFKTFFIANICKEFLQNDKYSKNEKKKNLVIRWFDYEKDSNLLIDEIKPVFEEIYNKNITNIKQDLKEGNNNIFKNKNNIGIKMNMNMNINNFNINTTMNPAGQNLGMNNMNINNMNVQQYLLQMMKMNKNMLNNNMNNNLNTNSMNPNLNNYLMQINQLQMNAIKNNNINMALNNPKLMKNNNTMNNINNINNPLLNKNMQLLSQINPQYLQNLQNLNQNNMPPNINFNNINKNNQMRNIKSNSSANNDEKNFNKYTCKYEILIANDKDYQIARKIIGSQGCNMKNIVNQCKSGNDSENIKLRLRGKGSGYKEGPENKESDEQLHLCISAKNPEILKKACLLVDELLDNIHEDYKKYCQENNLIPQDKDGKIAYRIDCKNEGFM